MVHRSGRRRTLGRGGSRDSGRCPTGRPFRCLRRQCQPEGPAESDNGFGHGLRGGSGRGLNERAVDLELVDGKILDAARRGVPGAEVVHGDADAQLAEALQGLAGLVGSSSSVDSVISNLTKLASIPLSRSASRTSSTCGSRTSRLETLTAMKRGVPLEPGLVAASRQDCRSTHRPIGRTRPRCSANGMNSAGATGPCWGYFQRMSPSAPTTSWVCRSTTGWYRTRN